MAKKNADMARSGNGGGKVSSHSRVSGGTAKGQVGFARSGGDVPLDPSAGTTKVR